MFFQRIPFYHNIRLWSKRGKDNYFVSIIVESFTNLSSANKNKGYLQKSLCTLSKCRRFHRI